MTRISQFEPDTWPCSRESVSHHLAARKTIWILILGFARHALQEDWLTKEIIACYPRAQNAYQSYEWAIVRLALGIWQAPVG